MNHALITTLPRDTQDLWYACISSHNIIDRWELKGQTFTDFICALLCNYGTWSCEPRLSTHHAMHKVPMRSNLPFMCPVTATPSSVWATTQPDQEASSDRISSFITLTTSLSCSPLCQKLTKKNSHECCCQYSIWPKWRQTCNTCWIVYMKNKFWAADKVNSVPWCLLTMT